MTKKTDYVTKNHFDEVLRRLLAKVAMREDLEELKERLVRLEVKFDAGFANLDTYLKRSALWYDEHVVLRASHKRL